HLLATAIRFDDAAAAPASVAELAAQVRRYLTAAEEERLLQEARGDPTAAVDMLVTAVVAARSRVDTGESSPGPLPEELEVLTTLHRRWERAPGYGNCFTNSLAMLEHGPRLGGEQLRSRSQALRAAVVAY